LPSLDKSTHAAVLRAEILCQTDTAINAATAKFIDQQRGKANIQNIIHDLGQRQICDLTIASGYQLMGSIWYVWEK